MMPHHETTFDDDAKAESGLGNPPARRACLFGALAVFFAGATISYFVANMALYRPFSVSDHWEPSMLDTGVFLLGLLVSICLSVAAWRGPARLALDHI